VGTLCRALENKVLPSKQCNKILSLCRIQRNKPECIRDVCHQLLDGFVLNESTAQGAWPDRLQLSKEVRFLTSAELARSLVR